MKSPINIDKAMKTPVSNLSAPEFLQALAAAKLNSGQLHAIADKKKVELWVEEGTIFKVNLEDLIERMKGEKKKVELEVLLDQATRVNPGSYQQLVEDVALRVESKLRGG